MSDAVRHRRPLARMARVSRPPYAVRRPEPEDHDVDEMPEHPPVLERSDHAEDPDMEAPILPAIVVAAASEEEEETEPEDNEEEKVEGKEVKAAAASGDYYHGREEWKLIMHRLPADYKSWKVKEVRTWLTSDETTRRQFEPYVDLIERKGVDGPVLALLDVDTLLSHGLPRLHAELLLAKRDRLLKRCRSSLRCVHCDKWEGTLQGGPCGHTLICPDCAEKADRLLALRKKVLVCPTCGEFVTYGFSNS